MRKPLTQKQLRLVQYFEESSRYDFSVMSHRDSYLPMPHNQVHIALSANNGEGYLEMTGPRWPIINLKAKLAERWYEGMKDRAKRITQELHDVEAYITEAEESNHEDT